MTIDLAARRWRDLEIGADVELGLWSRDRRRLLDVERHAPFLADLVVEASLGVVGTGVPADAATNVRAQRRAGNLPRSEVATADQRTRLGIVILDEVYVLSGPPDVLHAEIAVVHEDEAALVRMDDQLLTVALEHHELADGAVKVPRVVRQFLMIELQLAGIDIETDHRGRIEIVAGTRALRLVIGARPIVERRRVRGAPQNGVGLGVVGAGHPAATTTRTPGVTAPGLHRFVGAGDRQEFPFFLAGGGIDREDRATAGPFTALRTDDHRPLRIKGRPGEADSQLLGVD